MLIDNHNNILLQIVGNNVTLPQLPAITWQNAFGDVTATLILIVLMISITIRSSSEFIEKWVKGEAVTFNRKYAVTAAVAFVTSLPIAMGMLGNAADLFLSLYGTWGLAGALVMVGVYGYGWNHGTNKMASLLGHFFSPNKSPDSNNNVMTTTGTTPPEQPPNTAVTTKTIETTEKPVNPVS